MFNASRGICARTARFTGAIVVLATASMLAPGADAAGSCDATSHEDALELVRETTKALFTAVDAYDGVISDNPADARALVEEYITPHVDLKGSSKLVLGKYWKRATPEQQERFLTQFHALMLRTYATAVTSYTGIQIEYLPMREEKRANFATVRTLIPRNQGEAERLHEHRLVGRLQAGVPTRLYGKALPSAIVTVTCGDFENSIIMGDEHKLIRLMEAARHVLYI